MKKNCIIIGCGWLGRPLGEALSKRGFEVYGATRNKDKIKALLNYGINGFLIHFSSENISLELNSSIIKSTQLLIFTIPPTRFEDYAKQLLKIAQLFPKQTQIIFTSSTGVYKESLEVVDEDSPCDENHQVRKAEISLTTHFHERLIILRLAGLIGEKRHPVNYFLNKSAIPNGLAPVNLIQLNDVINAFLAIIHSGKKAMIFNVCAPQNPSKMEYYGEIAQQKFGIQLSFIAEGKGKIIDGSKIVKETSFAYNTSIFDVRF